jgi:hypothetical protein
MPLQTLCRMDTFLADRLVLSFVSFRFAPLAAAQNERKKVFASPESPPGFLAVALRQGHCPCIQCETKDNLCLHLMSL